MLQLLDAQKHMQVEADEVVRILGLNELLSEIGRPIRVGSSAMGLMVRRDIDITVVCDVLDDGALAAFTGIGARIMQRADCVVAVRFRNDTKDWNAEPDKYPDGLYLWLSVRMPDKTAWTIDIWLVDQPERQPDLAHLRSGSRYNPAVKAGFGKWRSERGRDTKCAGLRCRYGLRRANVSGIRKVVSRPPIGLT
ncbi:hypothetical protein ACU8V1_14035 [Rhizobium leguminosarum]